MSQSLQSLLIPSQIPEKLVQKREEVDWAEGWLILAELGFPLQSDIFDRCLHPLVSQYAHENSANNQSLNQLLQSGTGKHKGLLLSATVAEVKSNDGPAQLGQCGLMSTVLPILHGRRLCP